MSVSPLLRLVRLCPRLAVLLLLVFTGLGGCTYVPYDTDRAPQAALPPAQETVSRFASVHGSGLTGDRVVMAPLLDGNDGLGARLRMIGDARQSIDLKTFLIKPDTAGALVWLALYEAAERGVKIRILYDDVFTSASDRDIASLNVHPNVQIRSFNPLSRNSGVVMNFALDFNRVNRRMHNKAFIVDGALAIVGGRNIADEYYQIETATEFADFDLFVAGAPVRQLSDAFDLYWNDPWSVPVENLARGDDTPLRAALANLGALAEAPEAEVYRRAVGSTYLRDLEQGRIPAFTGRARVVVDQPAKLRNPPGQGPYVVGDALYNTLLRARREVLVLSPYFVPEDYGAAVFEQLARRGVRVRIVTNSLGATNHAYVHAGYARYRDRLLRAGVDIREVRTDAPSIVGSGPAPLVLHTKIAVVDDTTLYLGSANIDPRSIRQNTEIGMVIESSGLARNILRRFDEVADDFAFSVSVGADGAPVWRYTGGGLDETYTEEPNAGSWRKFQAGVAAVLPVEQQL